MTRIRIARWVRIAVPLLLLMIAATNARAKTSNGNDFALYYSEGKDAKERQQLFEDAKDRPHFFRYLQIMEMEEVDEDGRKGIKITAFEPASLMDIKFTVTKSVSLSTLRKDPVSKVGRAIAVTGKVASIDAKEMTITLEGTIVRHKDRLSPAIGKEFLYEVDPGAVFYNYTGGSRPVTLTYVDRDLIKHKDKIIAKGGPDGWVKFLEDEVAHRTKERAQKDKDKDKGAGKTEKGSGKKSGGAK